MTASRRADAIPPAVSADIEARFAFAFEAAGVAAWDWNVRTGALWWSPTLAELYGFEPDPQTPWRSFSQAMNPDDRPRMRAAIMGALRPEVGGWRIEYRIRRGGEWRWLQSRGRTTFGSDGEPLRVSGACWEITERKRMEAALRESEERFRSAAGLACDWVWETDAAHRFTYVFDRTGTTELPSEAFLGRTVAEVMGGTVEPERLRAHLRDLDAKRPFRDFVYWIRRRSGWRCCAISGEPMLGCDGAFRGYRGVGADVTERRWAEERLRLALEGSQGFLWDMRFDPSSDPYAPVDLYVEPGAKAIIGYADHELPTSIAVWHERVLPQDLRKLRRQIREYFTGRRATYEVEYRISHRDGSLRWISSRAKLSRDPDGRPIRMTGVIWDATARKEAEERQRLLLAELDHRVKNTLSRVQSILAQSMRGAASMQEFARAVEGRIAAAARTHAVLTRESWRGADLRDVALEELAPHAEAGNVRVEGEPVRLTPAAAVSFGMAFHELTTNAAKYGALSRSGGCVEVSWRRAAGRLRVIWTERGGPPVSPPPRRGFGSTLIERGLAYEMHGDVRLDFRPEGVRCLIDVPLREPA